MYTIYYSRDAPCSPILKFFLERSHTLSPNICFDFASPKDYIESYPCPAARGSFIPHHAFVDEEYEGPFDTDTGSTQLRHIRPPSLHLPFPILLSSLHRATVRRLLSFIHRGIKTSCVGGEWCPPRPESVGIQQCRPQARVETLMLNNSGPSGMGDESPVDEVSRERRGRPQ